MRADDFSYHVLQHPFPDDFVAWYPYIKPEVLGARYERWLRWLRRVIDEDVPGVRDRMIAARDPQANEWVGVVWTSVSLTCPEIAHFGWFYVAERCQGMGVGSRVIETCLSTLSADGVRVVMLPTQLENERAIGMYYRRGWQLTLTDPSGDVWMVREPAGFYEETFTPAPNRPIRAGVPEPADYVALDYLLSRPAAPIRLLPLGLVGSRRFISFVHDWEGPRHMVARQGGQPMALAVAAQDERTWALDVFGLDRRAMAVAAAELADNISGPRAEVAATDTAKRGALEDAGFRMDDTRTASIAGAQISLCRYVR